MGMRTPLLVDGRPAAEFILGWAVHSDCTKQLPGFDAVLLTWVALAALCFIFLGRGEPQGSARADGSAAWLILQCQPPLVYQAAYENSYSSCSSWSLTILMPLESGFCENYIFQANLGKKKTNKNLHATAAEAYARHAFQDSFTVKISLLACYSLITMFPFSGSMPCTKAYLLSSWQVKKLPFSGKQRQAEQCLRDAITLSFQSLN